MLQLQRGEKLPQFVTTVKKCIFPNNIFVEETCFFALKEPDILASSLVWFKNCYIKEMDWVL
jgi:hypothetical protein